jgi:hypothetical protein
LEPNSAAYLTKRGLLALTTGSCKRLTDNFMKSSKASASSAK